MGERAGRFNIASPWIYSLKRTMIPPRADNNF